MNRDEQCGLIRSKLRRPFQREHAGVIDRPRRSRFCSICAEVPSHKAPKDSGVKHHGAVAATDKHSRRTRVAIGSVISTTTASVMTALQAILAIGYKTTYKFKNYL